MLRRRWREHRECQDRDRASPTPTVLPGFPVLSRKSESVPSEVAPFPPESGAGEAAAVACSVLLPPSPLGSVRGSAQRCRLRFSHALSAAAAHSFPPCVHCHTHTHTHTCSRSHVHTLTFTHAHIRPHLHTHTHAFSYSHIHTFTHSHSSHKHSHIHTSSHTHFLLRIHTCTLTYTL